MNIVRIGVAVGLAGWLGLGDGGASAAARPRLAADGLLLAKATAEDKTDGKIDEKPSKKERKRERTGTEAKKRKEAKETLREGAQEEEGKARREERAAEPKEVTGVLTLQVDEDGGTMVIVTDANARVYQLAIPEDALQKARSLAGKRVVVKGQVRNRNDEFRIDPVHSCRPAPVETKTAAGEDGAGNE